MPIRSSGAGRASESEHWPIMAQQDVTGDIARAAVDRTSAGQHGGSIGLVLLIAVVLVGAAAGLLLIGRSQCRALHPGVPGRARHGRRVPAVCARRRHPAHRPARTRRARCSSRSSTARSEGILVTDAGGRVIYANAAYLDLIGATAAGDVRPVERVFIGDPGVSEAVYRLLKAAREGRRLQEEVRVGGHKGEPGRWLRMRVRPLGDGKRAAPHDGLVDRRRDARARAAGERLPGAPARHRLSRPCAGGLLLGRCRRQPLLSQRDARRMARPRSGAGRLRRAEACRRRGGRGRGAAHHAHGRARRREDRASRHRPQDPQRAHRAGAAFPQGRVRRRRRGRSLAHARAQPRARRRHRSAARRRGALRALLPQHPDGDRDRRQAGQDRALERAVRAAVPSGAQGRGRRQPLDPVGGRRARPRARSKPRSARRRPGRARSPRSTPRSKAPAIARPAST